MSGPNATVASMRASVDEFKVDLTRLEKSLLRLERDGNVTLEEEVDLLDALREVVERFKVVDSLLVTDVVRRASHDDKILILPRGGTAEINWGKPRKAWDHDRLGSVVSERIIASAMDPETGALEMPSSQLATEILKYTGISYWRVGELKKIGIDPAQYCEEGTSKPSIQIRRGNKRIEE